MSLNISVDKLTRLSIYLYIIGVMISTNTGTILVKLVRVFVAGMLIVYFFKIREGKIYKSAYCGWATLFFAYNIVACMWAFSKEHAIVATETLFYVVFINILLFQYMYRNITILFGVMKAIVAGALLKSVYIYMTKGFFVFLSSRSVAGTSANTIGWYCAIASIFCLFFYWSKKGNVYLMLAFVSLIFMVLSASRKSFIYIGIPLCIYYVFKNKNPLLVIRNIIGILVSIYVVMVLLFNVNFLYELVGWRIEGLIAGVLGMETDGSTRTRMILIEFGIKYFKLNPIKGYGLNNFDALLGTYKNWGYSFYAHNNYVELLVDCGIIGTIIYYWLYVKILLNGFKQVKEQKLLPLLAFGIMVAFIVGEYGLVSYNIPIYQLIIIMIYFILSPRVYGELEKNVLCNQGGNNG